jgi:hypothetical protein
VHAVQLQEQLARCLVVLPPHSLVWLGTALLSNPAGLITHTTDLLAVALKVLWERGGVQGAYTGSRRGGVLRGAMYADAAVQLLDATHHAVDVWDMAAQLGRHVVGPSARPGDAAAAGIPVVVRRLVEASALSWRNLSDWAQDIGCERGVRDGPVLPGADEGTGGSGVAEGM